MRPVLVSVLLLLILSLSFRDELAYLHYFINQDYIAEFLCINKDKPEMHCHGKCFLTKTIEENKEQEQEYPPLNLEDRIPVVYLQVERTPEIFSMAESERSAPCRDEHHPITNTHLYEVFHPPRIS